MRRSWQKRLLLVGLVLYALGTSLFLFEPFRRAVDSGLGPSNSVLVIMSETPIWDVRVRFAGEQAVTRPYLSELAQRNLVVATELRARRPDPVLEVSWTTTSGSASISRVMPPRDERFDCVFLLRLDAAGHPAGPSIADSSAPFDLACDYR